MTKTMNNEVGARIRDLITNYAVYGGDRAFDCTALKSEIAALSVVFIRRGKTAYRIATLADGTECLAYRIARKGSTWQPAFSVSRLRVA